MIEQARGRIPVIAGTGSNSTAEAIELTQHAAKAGAAGALVVTPYYNKPTQQGLYEHYRAIAQAVPDLPLIIYNIQGRTAVNMETETLARLAQIPNIVGVKEASGSLDQMTAVILACGPEFTVLSGDDNLTLPLMSVGGRGVISVVGNFLAREVADVTHAALEGDWKRARDLHLKLYPCLQGHVHRDQPDPGEGSHGHARHDPGRVAPADVPHDPGESGEAPPGTRPGRRSQGLSRPTRPVVELVIAGAAGRMGGRIIALARDAADLRVTGAFERPGHPRARTRRRRGRGRGPPGRGDRARRRAAPGTGPRPRGVHRPRAHARAPPARRRPGRRRGRRHDRAPGRAGRRDPTAGDRVPIMFSPNMSVGVNLAFRVLALMAKALGDDYDVEITEIHHRMKKDAPSGTAAKMAEVIAEALGRRIDEAGVYGRHGLVGERTHEGDRRPRPPGGRRRRRAHRRASARSASGSS